MYIIFKQLESVVNIEVNYASVVKHETNENFVFQSNMNEYIL